MSTWSYRCPHEIICRRGHQSVTPRTGSGSTITATTYGTPPGSLLQQEARQNERKVANAVDDRRVSGIGCTGRSSAVHEVPPPLQLVIRFDNQLPTRKPQVVPVPMFDTPAEGTNLRHPFVLTTKGLCVSCFHSLSPPHNPPSPDDRQYWSDTDSRQRTGLITGRQRCGTTAFSPLITSRLVVLAWPR